MKRRSFIGGLPITRGKRVPKMNEVMNITGTKPETMTSLEIAEVVNKRHDNVKRTIESLADQGVIQRPQIEEVKNHLGQAVQVCFVGERDSYVVVARLSPEFTAKLVDYWQKSKRPDFGRLPDLSDPVLLVRLLTEHATKRIEAEKRADEAERTKAEIGHRREATAMNTASQAVKKANKLEKVLDRSQEYATVKRMTMLYHGQEFSWRELKHVALEMGIPSVDVFDANYGTVKAYHADVWRSVYALEIPRAEEPA